MLFVHYILVLTYLYSYYSIISFADRKGLYIIMFIESIPQSDIFVHLSSFTFIKS